MKGKPPISDRRHASRLRRQLDQLYQCGGRPATAAPRIQSSWPTLAPLPGGRFLLAWTQLNVDNVAAGIDVKARIFSPAQGPIGQVTQFNTSTGSQRFSLSAATTSGSEGEIAFAAWTDDSQTGGDPSGRAVRGRPLAIPPGGVLMRGFVGRS
jgi:hypothetical protein